MIIPNTTDLKIELFVIPSKVLAREQEELIRGNQVMQIIAWLHSDIGKVSSILSIPLTMIPIVVPRNSNYGTSFLNWIEDNELTEKVTWIIR